ncbi:VOC family protein [Psychromicrobium xiongbiense]|uniref:VOC family protein n=1 Tax=Psychromicrobium xiongbiense TaxID=3051184 RepID=UPI00255404D4|nr:VOC family protein [Psychromicrobium sp. YIM S02556]
MKMAPGTSWCSGPFSFRAKPASVAEESTHDSCPDCDHHLKTHLPQQVARFWRDLLDYRVAANHSSSIMLAGDTGPTLLIQPATEMVPPGAIHLDLRPENQAECVSRA